MDETRSSDAPRATLSRLLFSGGESIRLSPNDIILLVGPNNAGKSRSLIEISDCLNVDDRNLDQRFVDNLVIAGVELHKQGSKEDLWKFLVANGQRTGGGEHVRYENYEIGRHDLNKFDGRMLGSASQVFSLRLDASSRLQVVETQQGAGAAGIPSVPQHFLYSDEAKMRRLSREFREAFGLDLFFDFRGAPQLPIHVGSEPVVEEGEDRVSDSYVEKVRSFPELARQGDGIKSYAGILFQTMVFPRQMIFIDEPEAFLHPPQMRRLGKTLAKQSAGQLIVATHSADILRGFLDGNSERVRVIRLQRHGDRNHATELPPERVGALWSHPQIRYSTALDAIFHEQAIVCEDDSDCRLYSAVAEHLESADPENRWPDTHFIPAGGKSAMPRVSEALSNLGVPVTLVFDFDILSNKQELRAAYESVGGDWEDIRALWTGLDQEVRKGVPAKTNDEIAKVIQELLANREDRIPKSEIVEALKADKSWSVVKKMGSIGIPNGQASERYEELRMKLNSAGIFVVEKGEVENFCPKLGGHGPKFVAKVLQEMNLADDSLSDLREFVESFVFKN